MIKTQIRLKYPAVDATFPAVTAYLKQQEQHGAAVKKAATFTEEEVRRYLSTAETADDAILRKAFFCVAYYGGLRTAEAYAVMKADINDDDFGSWVHYTPLKNRGQTRRSVFLVPKGDPQDRLHDYKNKLHSATSTQPYLWHAIRYCGKRSDGFKLSRFGINSCRTITIQVAKTLGLADPDRYGPFC